MKTFLRSLFCALALPAAGGILAAAPAPEQPVPDQLDLKAAIVYALDNNFAIRQARERIRQQEGVVLEVRAREIPNVAAAGAYQHNDKALSSAFPPTDRSLSVSVTASQILYSGGSVRASVKSADLVREAAVLEMKGIVNAAILQVRIKFYDILLAREKIKVQEQNIQLLESQLKNATDRFEAGTTSSFEKLRSEVALANGQVPLITARNDYRIAVEELRQALGYTNIAPENIRKVPEFIGTLGYAPLAFDLQAALTAAHETRPEIQRLERLISAREESIAAAKAGNLPNLALFGGWQYGRGWSSAGSNSRDGLLVGLQSQWNIFDGNATRGRVAQARSAVEQAKLATSEQTLAIDVEVRRAFSTLQQATELAEASQKVVAQAGEALRLATARYSAGTATQLDVLTSQVDLTTARTNQIQAYYGHNVAVANLRRAMGLADEFIGGL
jgi:outer membrane protein TolC